jgi:uncharacterized protein YwqG
MEEKFQKVIDIFKETTRKHCYSIDLLDEVPDILDDKIGGTPYLPVGEEYPVDKSGNPLALLLQINLKNIDLDGFPKKGILEIFTDKGLDYPCTFAVKYFEEGLEYKKKSELPRVSLRNYLIKKSYKITYAKKECYMPSSDYRFKDIMCGIINEVYKCNVSNLDDIENYFGNYDWYDRMQERCENPFITIGGYPDFTQEDPRVYMKKPRNECLFKLDSSYDYKIIEIGDAGIMDALIAKDDLKKCNFNNAIVDWDCC